MAGTVRKLAAGVVLLAAAGGAVFWFLTAPERIPEADIAALGAGDVNRGERMFYAGGCASCHAAAQADPAGGVPPFPAGPCCALSRHLTTEDARIPSSGSNSWSAARRES